MLADLATTPPALLTGCRCGQGVRQLRDLRGVRQVSGVAIDAMDLGAVLASPSRRGADPVRGPGNERNFAASSPILVHPFSISSRTSATPVRHSSRILSGRSYEPPKLPSTVRRRSSRRSLADPLCGIAPSHLRHGQPFRRVQGKFSIHDPCEDSFS